ncbi:MAG: VOC family protein [Flavobacterium sp.]|nr:MAG: VOC family protein [Flavobacterium sp.]
MNQQLNKIALLVNDYDEAIAFYVNILKFELIEDTVLSPSKRWVVVKPKGAGQCGLLLAKAATTVQKNAIGNQTGGRVFLFLYTDDLDRDHQNLLQHHVQIIREPSNEGFGRVLVFADLYGNLWDLIQPDEGT